MKIFSINLKKIRIERNLSVKEVADAVGVCPSTIYNWEKGKGTPLLSHMVKISQLFKVRLNDLAGI